jgi:plastocyanin
MKTLVRLVTILGLAAPVALLADTVTLPVAASVVGQAPFFSDVRVFNTSYTDVVNVTATYRCNPATAGCSPQPVKAFALAPREAKPFDNICVSLFNVPNSLGAVEFSSSSAGIVVTSRLYSPAASPPWPAGTVGSVGMFIPGLPSSAAQPVTVLTNLANAGSATGSFRTNIGVYNPNPTAVVATIRLYEFEGSFPPVLLGVMPVNLAAQTGTQVSNIYQALGFGTLQTTSGYATVESGDASKPLFTYAATADNTTQDPILVVGAADVAAPAGFHPPTPTTTSGSAGNNPTPTPTPTGSGAQTRIVNVGGNGNTFTDTVSGSGATTIHVGDTIQWVWKSGPHSTTSGTCSSGGYYGGDCSGDGSWDSGTYNAGYMFSQKFMTAGSFHYFCSVHQGSMTGTITVQ